jgi:hypothetical protein
MSAPLSCITIANCIRYAWRFARWAPCRQFWPIRIPVSILISSGKASRVCRAVPVSTGSSLSGNCSLSWPPSSQVRALKRSDNKLVIFVSPVNDRLIDTYSSREYAARCHIEFSTAHESLLRYLDRQGIPYIDGSGRFESKDFVDLVHVNARGERRIAELLDGYVTSGGRSLLPLISMLK